LTDGNPVARPASPSRRTRGVRARSRPSPSEGGKGRTSRRGKSIRDCLFCPRGTGCAGAGLRGLGRDRPPAGVIGASRSGLRHRVGERGPARKRIELEEAVRSDATEGFGVERPRPGLSKSARSGSGNGARAKRRSCLLWPSDRAHNRFVGVLFRELRKPTLAFRAVPDGPGRRRSETEAVGQGRTSPCKHRCGRQGEPFRPVGTARVDSPSKEVDLPKFRPAAPLPAELHARLAILEAEKGDSVPRIVGEGEIETHRRKCPGSECARAAVPPPASEFPSSGPCSKPGSTLAFHRPAVRKRSLVHRAHDSRRGGRP